MGLRQDVMADAVGGDDRRQLHSGWGRRRLSCLRNGAGVGPLDHRATRCPHRGHGDTGGGLSPKRRKVPPPTVMAKRSGSQDKLAVTHTSKRLTLR